MTNNFFKTIGRRLRKDRQSTLLNLTAGLLKPTAGTIRVLGGPPPSRPAQLGWRRTRVGILLGWRRAHDLATDVSVNSVAVIRLE